MSKDLSILKGVSSTVGRSPRHSRGTKAGMSFSPELGALTSRDTDSGRHLDEHRNLLHGTVNESSETPCWPASY